MPRIIRLLSLFYMLLFLSTQGPCLAETVETTTPEVHSGDSVERLAIAVENLARLFANQATEEKENKELRKLDIAISYLNFRSRRIELMDRDLSMTKNERDRMEDVTEQWRDRKEILRTEMEGKSTEEVKELEKALQELEVRLRALDQRSIRLEEEIIIQENQISDLQNELNSVESYIQQHLQL